MKIDVKKEIQLYGKGLKVLLVDDDQISLEMYMDAFSEYLLQSPGEIYLG